MVTLSRRFYEVLGDEAANELASWLNTADASGRAELRELFRGHAALLEGRMDRLEARMDGLNRRMDDLARSLTESMNQLEQRLTMRQEALEERITLRQEALEHRLGRMLERQKSDMMRLTIVLWLGTLGAGIFVRLWTG